MLIEQAESEYKIKVTNDDVEKAWKDACKSAGGEKAFESQLKMYGYTEDTYKSSLQSSLAQQKLKRRSLLPPSPPIRRSLSISTRTSRRTTMRVALRRF